MIIKALLAVRSIGRLPIELKIVLITFAVIVFLPILAVVALASTASQPVSNVLAWVNPTSKKVEVRDVSGTLRQFDVATTWPVKGVVTQEFGHPNFPYEAAHSGIDIGAPIGEPVTVFLPGKVTKAGSVTLGCGLCVHVDHGYGIVSSYSHLSVVLAKEGQGVKPGDTIGKVGETGWAHGTHLHFTIKLSGILLNPRTFISGNPPLRGN